MQRAANGAIDEISCTEFRLKGNRADNKQAIKIEGGSHEHWTRDGVHVLSTTP